MSKMLKYRSSEVGLVDVWRSTFPNCRDFTFYSHRHTSYSRIDYFFTPKDELHRITNMKILPMTMSDHSPMELLWDIEHKKTSKLWRLNASLLNNKEFISFVISELKLYLSINDATEVSPLIVWDCAKAYLRGQIISFTSAKKRERTAKQQELEHIIKNLKKQHKQTPNSQLLNKIKDV